jgi:aconitate hydratase
MGAKNSFNNTINLVKNQLTGRYDKTPLVADFYRNAGISSIIIGDENYGEGSSREHAAMEPRFVGVKAVLVKSFARIHETNLKKQGVLALTFKTKSDYDKIQEEDRFDILGLIDFQPGKPLLLTLHHADGKDEEIVVNHTYNLNQIDWFKAGSALNGIAAQTKQ